MKFLPLPRLVGSIYRGHLENSQGTHPSYPSDPQSFSARSFSVTEVSLPRHLPDGHQTFWGIDFPALRLFELLFWFELSTCMRKAMRNSKLIWFTDDSDDR